jgi:sugar phosphate isomerase/epimerase
LNIAVSSCCNPDLALEDLLTAYSGIGFHRLELFTSWTKSALDYKADFRKYLDIFAKYKMQLISLHLPAVPDVSDASIDEAVIAAHFAVEMGASVVVFKAKSRELYIKTARIFLDRVEGLPVTTVLQNHARSPISTLHDVKTVKEGIADPRMKSLLEVGHFHSVGVSWQEACSLLGNSIALVHIKDQMREQSVPFGNGEIDLSGLFGHLRAVGYQGDIVVEMEVADRENTLNYLRDAKQYMLRGISQ